MNHNSDIEKELREISPLISTIERKIYFSIPPGYFEQFPSQVVEQINLNSTQPGIAENKEITEISPLIASLKDKPTLRVPPDYFNTLSQIITDRVSPAAAPVINLRENRKTKWKGYAVAAAITGIIGIALFFQFYSKNNDESFPFVQKIDFHDLSTQLPKISDTDLTNYLSSIPVTSEWIAGKAESEFDNIAFLKIDDTNFSDLFYDIPDDILNNYEKDFSTEISL